jgi:hypothetical protein
LDICYRSLSSLSLLTASNQLSFLSCRKQKEVGRKKTPGCSSSNNPRPKREFVSAFNAQGLRVIIVVVQVGAVKIYARTTTVEALMKNERQDETFSLPPRKCLHF